MNPTNYNPPSPPGSFLSDWRAQVTMSIIATLGTPGTYGRKAGGTAELSGIWKAPYSNDRLDGMGIPGVESAQPALIYRTLDLPAPAPVHGDTWSDGSMTWFVTEVRPNPRQGMTVLILSLDPPQ